MNNKGFTLIELMACVVIIGFLSLVTYPSIRNALSTNSSMSCVYYERAMVSACKYFIQKESVDIIESNGGFFPSNKIVSLQTLLDSDYIEPYTDTKSTITNASVSVDYDATTHTYTYTPHLKCISKNGTNLYEK